MKSPNTKLKLIAVVALVAIAACFVVRARAAAQPAPVKPVLFGMVGITRNQTARINVVNLINPPDPDAPPTTTQVTMTFVDSDGNVLRNTDGQLVRREATLAPGHSAFLQIAGDPFIGRDEVRVNFRPVVRVLVQPPDPDRVVVPTLEVIDNATGKTTLLSGGSPHLINPPDPDTTTNQ
jgi:hypothetical protein